MLSSSTTLDEQKPAFGSPVAAASEAASSRNWVAVYTASNHEKRVEQYLQMQGIETFLPLYSVTKRWKNRTTAKLQLPLFSGYVFAKIARTEKSRVLAAPMVRWIVGNGRELSPLSDYELDTLRSGLQLRQADPYPYLKAGDRVRIRSGALAGMEGLVLYKSGRLRVVLSIDAIMQSFSVHVDADELESC
jgi:transcription antitermination factor NusG